MLHGAAARHEFTFTTPKSVFERRSGSELERRKQAPPGVAFYLIQKLLAFTPPGHDRVEVVIVSRNDPVSGLRVFRSAQAASLKVERGVFTRGRPAYQYLRPLKAGLFLSASEEDVREALVSGVPAARVYPASAAEADQHPTEVRIAFDGDAVLFSDQVLPLTQDDGVALDLAQAA